MSASGKLSSLGATASDVQVVDDAAGKAALRVLTALPQIVAVVEAAEDINGEAPSPGYIESGLGAALTALEEALP